MKQFGPKKRRQRRSQDPQWDKFFDPEDPADKKAIAAHKRQETLGISLADTDLSVRIVNALEDKGVYQVRDLARKTRDELLEISNFGEQTLQECKQVLKDLGVPHPNWNRRPRRRKTKRLKK